MQIAKQLVTVEYWDPGFRPLIMRNLAIDFNLTHLVEKSGLQLFPGQELTAMVLPDDDDIFGGNWQMFFNIEPLKGEEKPKLPSMQLDTTYGYCEPNEPIIFKMRGEQDIYVFADNVYRRIGKVLISLVSLEEYHGERLHQIVADIPINGRKSAQLVIWEESPYSLEGWRVFSYARKYFPNLKELYPEECLVLQRRERTLRLEKAREKKGKKAKI